MKKTNSNIAFVYHYWNINNLMSYYGYKERIIKNYMPKDIFVKHPLGENSTNTHYCSSCKQERWKEACKNGEIYGEIIAIFTGENAGNLAHEYEHQMIITHKKLYGAKTLYNISDGYSKFSIGGHHLSKERKEQISRVSKEVNSRPEVQKKRRESLKETFSRPEVKERLCKAQKIAHANPETHKKRSKGVKEALSKPEVKEKWMIAMKEANSRPETHKKRSESAKIANNKPGARERMSKSVTIALSKTEVRQKMSENQKKTWTPERRKNHSEIQKIIWTPEQKEKQSKTQKISQNKPEVKEKQIKARIGRKWINNGIETKWIFPQEIELYLSNGWKLGRGKLKNNFK